MDRVISRRTVLAGAMVLAMPAARSAAMGRDDAQARLEALEQRSGGRLGVALLDTGTGATIAHRADERFPMCSTFKFLAAAAVLARVDQGKDVLTRRIAYTTEDLVAWSPATEKLAGSRGLTLAELCAAAVTLSDNTAANLLLEAIGGPAGLTAYARSLGDEVTRLDRYEPELNHVSPGDPRDTTTPAAMLANLQKIVLGTALSASSRAQMTEWLVANKTGDARLRAGLPKGWRIGDKTGTNRSSSNDIAVIWPPRRGPIIVSAYMTESTRPSRERDGILKDVGTIVAELS